MAARVSLHDLHEFVGSALRSAGLPDERASDIADVLVKTDAMGHATHGVALLPRYLDEIESGAMARNGDPRVIADHGAVLVMDGCRLPGCWLMRMAMNEALDRAERFGTSSVSLSNSHHVGGLVTHLLGAAKRRFAAVIFSSAPGVSTVAPFGGASAVLSPAPVAAILPTETDPILIDISASISTNNMAFALKRQGRKYETDCLIGSDGRPSNDPDVLSQGGAHLPAGGLGHGHKGYGWGLVSEILSQGLSGYGRSDGAEGMTNAVLIQAYKPEAFAGAEYFMKAASHIAKSCRNAAPIDPTRPVRLPGEAALARLRDAERSGLRISGDQMKAIRMVAARSDLSLPASANEDLS